MGIEPTSSAWKAEVIAIIRHPPDITGLYYRLDIRLSSRSNTYGGGGRIRTPKPKQQIYSLPPLTAREPLQKLEAAYFA